MIHVIWIYLQVLTCHNVTLLVCLSIFFYLFCKTAEFPNVSKYLEYNVMTHTMAKTVKVRSRLVINWSDPSEMNLFGFFCLEGQIY